jgi:hypothetical protein
MNASSLLSQFRMLHGNCPSFEKRWKIIGHCASRGAFCNVTQGINRFDKANYHERNGTVLFQGIKGKEKKRTRIKGQFKHFTTQSNNKWICFGKRLQLHRKSRSTEGVRARKVNPFCQTFFSKRLQLHQKSRSTEGVKSQSRFQGSRSLPNRP